MGSTYKALWYHAFGAHLNLSEDDLQCVRPHRPKRNHMLAADTTIVSCASRQWKHPNDSCIRREDKLTSEASRGNERGWP